MRKVEIEGKITKDITLSHESLHPQLNDEEVQSRDNAGIWVDILLRVQREFRGLWRVVANAAEEFELLRMHGGIFGWSGLVLFNTYMRSEVVQLFSRDEVYCIHIVVNLIQPVFTRARAPKRVLKVPIV